MATKDAAKDLFSEMTERERTLIKDTFHYVMEDKSHAGQKVVFHYLDNWPQYKALWPKFKDVSDSHLMGVSATFSDTFFGALQKILDSWGSDDKQLHDKADEAVHHLDKSHRSHYIGKTHIMHLFEVFDPVIKSCAGPDHYTPEAKEAWKKFFEQIATAHPED